MTHCRHFLVGVIVLCASGIMLVVDASPPDPDAIEFAELPQMWGARLSPDGSMISFLRIDQSTDQPVAVVLREGGSARVVLGASNSDFELRWCGWANDTRLVCGLQGTEWFRGFRTRVTRLAAVNADGSDALAVLRRRFRNSFQFLQDHVISWLPDESDYILIRIREHRDIGVGRLNVNTGVVADTTRPVNRVWDWIADSEGNPRLKLFSHPEKSRWSVQMPDSTEWATLHEFASNDITDKWFPLGFALDPNVLLLLKPHNNRLALWNRDLKKDKIDQVVFSHPQVDVEGVVRIGKYDRPAAALYTTDRIRQFLFDPRVKAVVERIAAAIPGEVVDVADESWDRRYYLVRATGDDNPGIYYRFDTKNNKLEALVDVRPRLRTRELAAPEPASYSPKGGESTPTYVTVPPEKESRSLPAIVVAGSPPDRDAWGFKWLTQLLVARGFVVLQGDFDRGTGLRTSLVGDGVFLQWKRKVSEIVDGAAWLVDSRLADPDKICVLGWGFGGYLSLMTAVEHPDIFACAVSISGATDPASIAFRVRNYVGENRMRAMVTSGENVLTDGSPLKRAKEFRTPVLLAHGTHDVHIDVNHSKRLHKALRRNDLESELLIYERADETLWNSNHRADLLRNLERFLRAHVGDEALARQQ